jgi:hypothetical protein
MRNIRFNGKVTGALYTGGLIGYVDGVYGPHLVDVASVSGSVFSGSGTPVGGAYGKVNGVATFDNHYLNNIAMGALGNNLYMGGLMGQLYGSSALDLTLKRSALLDIRAPYPYDSGSSFYLIAGYVAGATGTINYASSIVDKASALPSGLSPITVLEPSGSFDRANMTPPMETELTANGWDPHIWTVDQCSQCYPRLR